MSENLSMCNTEGVNIDKKKYIGIVAGEASGDTLGAGLIRALREYYPECEFVGIGGPKMLAEGFKSLYPQDRLAVMGLVEPLKRLPELLSIRKSLKKYFSSKKTDLFIGIDSPDFNLGLELALRKNGVKTCHYVSPSVWAWRQGRLKKIAHAVDLMLTLFPFEKKFYDMHKIPVVCVGHTLADQIPRDMHSSVAKRNLALDESSTYVGILPGSRHGEIAHLTDIYLETARLCLAQKKQLKFIIPALNNERKTQIEAHLKRYSDLPVEIIDGHAREVMAASDVLLVTSGTSTLEAMLVNRPMVIAYKTAWLSYTLISPFVKVKYIGLPNLLADQPLVPEYVQKQVNPEALSEALLSYLDKPQKVTKLKQQFDQINESLRGGASNKAAQALVELEKSSV